MKWDWSEESMYVKITSNNHHNQIEVTLVASFPLHLSLAVKNPLHEAFEHDYIGVVS